MRILDACAAPWGKTSQLAEKYPDAEIWAFEPQKIRFEKMCYNLEKLGIKIQNISKSTSWEEKEEAQQKSKWGIVYCVHDSVENIGKYIETMSSWMNTENPNFLEDSSSKTRDSEWRSEREYFDMILVDAPCSGEGALLYNNTKFLENWSMEHIHKNYARQKRICDNALPYLKTWWEFIYCTCTIAPEENEAVIHYLLCKYKNLELEKLDIQKNKYISIEKWLKQFGKYIFRKEIPEKTLRIIPNEFAEGFYIAKMKKWEDDTTV